MSVFNFCLWLLVKLFFQLLYVSFVIVFLICTVFSLGYLEYTLMNDLYSNIFIKSLVSKGKYTFWTEYWSG